MTITQIPGWSENIGDKIPKVPLSVYMRVPLVYKCANLVANSAATAPLYLYNDDQQIDWLYKQPIHSLFRRIAKDTQLCGKSYVLKMMDSRHNVHNLRRLNPYYMQHDVIGIENGYPVYQYTQRFNYRGKQITQTYEHHEIMYFRLDSEANDVDPDVYPASVALGAGRVRAYLEKFGENYFDKGGMPTTILHVEGEPSDEEMGKFEKWIKRTMSGIGNAFRVIPLRKKVTATTLNPPAKDLAIPELDEKSRKDVLDAFGVPEGMVEKTANYASADVANRQFWDMTTKPLVELIVDAFNEQLFDGTPLMLKAELEELPVYQVDESRRSASFANYVSAGVSLEGAMHILGIEKLPDDIPLREQILEIPEKPQMLDSGDSDSGLDEGGESAEEGGFKMVIGLDAEDKPSAAAYAYIPLPNNPSILGIQRQLREIFIDDRIEWQVAPTLHITLCFAGFMTDEAISKAVSLIDPERMEIQFELDPIAYFDTPDGKALHLKVMHNTVLDAIQADFYSAFMTEAHDLSEFSAPGSWNPHVTLAYVPNDIEIDLDRLNQTLGQRLTSVSIDVDTFIIGRDNYDPQVILTSPNYVKSVATRPSLFTHLDQWKSKAINRMRQQKAMDFEFASELIPESMKAAIEGALTEVHDFEDIRHIFDNAVDLSHLHSYEAV